MKTLSQWFVLFVLFSFSSINSAQAQTSLESLINDFGVLIFDLDLEEYSAGPRTGPARVYGGFPPGSNPWLSGALLDPSIWPPLPAALDIDIGGICGTNVFLAGGETAGWMFGPYLPGDPATALADIRDILPGAPAGTVAYVALVGTSLPDGNHARRFPCGGGTTLVEFGIQLAFIYPTSTFISSGRYQIGEFLYITEIGGNFYRILSPQPFRSSSSSAPVAPKTFEWRGGQLEGNGLVELIEQLQGVGQ